MTVGGTQDSYSVDVYSGNHPFYQGATSMIITEDGQMNKFAKKFEGLGELGEVPVLAGGPAVAEEKKAKGGGKGKGKGKK
jgi:large subunit ribosomal protein L31